MYETEAIMRGRSTAMPTSENDPFLAFLFDEKLGRTLTNIKFFEGSACADGATLRAAAFAALSKSFEAGGIRVDNPPKMTRVQRPVREFLAQI